MMKLSRPIPRRLAILVFLLATLVSLSAQQKPDCTVKVTLLQVNDVYQFAPVDQGPMADWGEF